MSEDKMKETQEVPQITAADVLEVFRLFQDGLLERIDKRDANVLALMHKTVSELLADNHRLNRRGDDVDKRVAMNSRDIEELRKKQNDLTSEVAALKLAMERIDPKKKTQGQ
jgi:hypothetical protein